MSELLFETNRLIIRKLNINDVELLYKYSKEDITKKELPDEVFDSIEHTSEIVTSLISNYNDRYPLVYGIILKSEYIIIGHLSLSKIDKGIEIGYAISFNYLNKGYATEVILSFVKWAKNELGLSKIYGIAKEENIASWKVLENNGFVFEEEGIYKNYFKGKYKVKIYGI